MVVGSPATGMLLDLTHPFCSTPTTAQANAARSEATRAPWFREGSQAARRKPAVLQVGCLAAVGWDCLDSNLCLILKPYLLMLLQAQAQQGTGVWVPQAARGLRG